MALATQRSSATASPAPARPALRPARPRAPVAPIFLAGTGLALRLRGARSESGKRLYHASDGRTVELPPDMTVEEAARLEGEARAAEKQLGKGPPPQPVPDPRKPADKSGAKKPSPKGEAKGRRAQGGKGGALPKTAGVVARLTAGTRKVAQYLVAKATPVLARGIGGLRKLSQNEQTHDDAPAKLHQSEKAVVIPTSEGQSRSNADQVGAVGGRPAPVTDENRGKQTLQESLAQNVPQNIEDVDNFKRDKKAQHIGAEVLKVAQGDKNAVVSTFADLERTPPPTPPEQGPEPLPAEEKAPATASLSLGQGAVAALQPEHTDVSNFTKEADSKLTEEGVTQEQLDMVDQGELAEANKEKKGMEKAAKTEPLAVQKSAQQEAEKVDKDLKQEEKQKRGAMTAKRKAGLGATAQKQKGTKNAFEKKRDEVAGKVNGIYKAAQDRVKKKLADLESLSMKRFDDGNAKATREFEDNVNRELAAFKADRYSGFFGWARKAKDWLLGMDDLPAVKAIFDRNRAAFVATLNKLVADISADNKRVVQDCQDELARAKNEIKEFVNKLGPDLKDIGQKAAGEVNEKLAELDGFVRKKEAELQQALADKQQAAIKAIDEKIEKMKEAMAGALAKLGKLLLWAAKKFFTWALSKFGYSLGEIEGIISKGAAVLKAIFTKPIVFVKNLMSAAITGFKNFGKHFLKHLQDALFEWLTGSLEGLVLPKTWNLQGIVGLALQMIGISYQNLRGHMVTVMGEPVVAGLEKGFTLVKTLITEGPMAAWEQLKEMAGEMRNAFIEAVKDFIKTKIVEQAIQWVATLLIPGAGIIKAIIGIYDTVVFLIKKAKQIAKMISNFLGSIGEIAAGNIGAAAEAMESGLARGLSLVISFLAQLLRLNGITAKIRNAVQKVKGKVDEVLLKVAKWIAAKAAKLFGKVKAAAARFLEWWKLKKVLNSGGKKLTVSTEGTEDATMIIVANSPGVTWSEYLKKIKPTKEQKNALQKAKELAVIIEKKRTKATLPEDHAKLVEKSFNELASLILILNGAEATPASVIEYGGTNAAGGGVEAKARILSEIHPPGSSPKDYADVWTNLEHLGKGLGRKVRKDWYVQGHLLNENLGGPGMRFNLTPITKEANNKHKTEVETELKKNVNEEKPGKVISYTVKALEPPPKGKNPRRIELETKKKKKPLTPEETLELESVKALAKLSRGFKCTAFVLEQDASKKWTKKGKALDKASQTIDNDIEKDGKTYGY